jgi:CubicO group peptidase (beta-lactamase class C family)
LKQPRRARLWAIPITTTLLILFFVSALDPTFPPPERAGWPTDDWHEAAPEIVGLDGERLQTMERHIETDLPHIYSVLIVRYGYLAYERYYQGFHAGFPFEVASITKSITSALVGIALDEGYLQSLDQRVMDFFPDLAAPELDSQTGELTLRHLLTMTSGYSWSEDGPWRWPHSGSWFTFALKMTIADSPGARFGYNTPAAHLLSGVLARAAGQSAADFAQAFLFEPLGIARPDWMTDPEGYTTGAHGLSLRARDLAKFGYLYLNRGQWDGRQVVPAAWVDESTRRQVSGGFPQGEDYGYLWWTTAEAGHPAYFAAGYGGQYVEVIPALDMVVVITSAMDDLHVENRRLVADFIVPAARP